MSDRSMEEPAAVAGDASLSRGGPRRSGPPQEMVLMFDASLLSLATRPVRAALTIRITFAGGAS